MALCGRLQWIYCLCSPGYLIDDDDDDKLTKAGFHSRRVKYKYVFTSK